MLDSDEKEFTDCATSAKSKRYGFVQKTYSLGADQSFRWDKALEVAAALEDEELDRKLSLQK